MIVRGGARVLVLRAKPEWDHGDLTVGGHTVRVVAGVSQLAILDAYEFLAPDEYLVVLTDRRTEDLGDVVFARALTHDIVLPDEWDAIPALFPGAQEVSLDLRRHDWAATALLDHEPPGGWPADPGEIAVSAEHALGALLACLVGQEATTRLDEVLLLTVLNEPQARKAWRAAGKRTRKGLLAWAETELGRAAAFALRVAAASEHVAPLAVALAVDVLWPGESEPGSSSGHASEEQVAARARVEKYFGGHQLGPAEAREIADAAHAAVLRLSLDDRRAHREVPVLLEMAEALLGDLRWPAGAEQSRILPAGYTARARRLAASLTGKGERGDAAEEALADLLEHRVAQHEGGDVVPRMAVRLHRWLTTKDGATQNLEDDLRRQVDDGAWADAALGAIWQASGDPEVSNAYRALTDQVRERRRARDEVAARRLSDAGAGLEPSLAGVVPAERLLSDIVAPWRSKHRVLLVVLDGMSAAVAAEIADDVARHRLTEWVPENRRRIAGLAALPTETAISRTSLFTGQVRAGDAAAEKRGLAKAFPKAVLFHKKDLRTGGGDRLPETVTSAMADPKVPVVGVVINVIDDAIHKTDTSAQVWSVARLAPLGALLEQAVLHWRTVVITSDHGHVVERGTKSRRVQGDAEARWRRAAPDDVARPGEVIVSGPRVVAGEGSAGALLWREDERHGPVQSGYHGGASLAEITIPVLVYQGVAQTTAPDGWVKAPPQAPTWWHDPVAVPPDRKKRTFRQARQRAERPETTTGQEALFKSSERESAEPAPERDFASLVVASEVYREERESAGQAAADDVVVYEVLKTLIDRDGSAHRDTLASAAGIAAGDVESVLAAVRRVLNVDGHPVLSDDDRGETVRLDETLLRRQFDVED